MIDANIGMPPFPVTVFPTLRLLTFGMINFKRDQRREPTHAAQLASRKNDGALPGTGARRRRLRLLLFV
jgi:hypothetical protein